MIIQIILKLLPFDAESSNKLKIHLEGDCGLDVSEKSMFDPCILISGVPHDIDDEHIISELCFRNNAAKISTKILRRISSIESRYDRVVVRCCSAFRDSVLRVGRVFIGSTSFRVEDYIHVLKCFKCQRYGHLKKLHSRLCLRTLCGTSYY